MKVLAFLPPCTLQRRVLTALNARQFTVESAVSAEECLRFTLVTEYEAVLVDAHPGNYRDVLVLVKLLRQKQPNQALFIFEHDLDLDQRLGLFHGGVDDCVHVPFFSAEFAVRLCATIRLRQAASNLLVSETGALVLRSGDLELDLVRRRVARRGRPIDLRPKEFQLLEYLVRNANRSVTRTMILEHLWNSTFEGLTNVVEVHISALRRKLDRDFPHKLIQTDRGIGYTFTSAAAARLAKETIPPQSYKQLPYVSGE
jgi:two-component system OmpR family response regulator